jgi:hypothetical protein
MSLLDAGIVDPTFCQYINCQHLGRIETIHERNTVKKQWVCQRYVKDEDWSFDLKNCCHLDGHY